MKRRRSFTSRRRPRRLGRVGHRRMSRGARTALIVMATIVPLLVAVPWAVAAVLGGDRTPCAVAFAADRSGSANAASLDAERLAAATKLVKLHGDCDALILESIAGAPGESKVWTGPLRGSGDTDLDRRQDGEHNRKQALIQVKRIFESPAGGLTDIVTWFHDSDETLKGLPKGSVVDAWLFTDGLNVVPVNLYTADTSPQGVALLVASLGQLPDCHGWRVRFIGVNRQADGEITDAVAQGAERFWRAFVQACGGNLVTYGPTLPA